MRYVGLVAQEVQPVLPEAVDESGEEVSEAGPLRRLLLLHACSS